MRLTASRALGLFAFAAGMAPGVRQLYDNSFLTHLATGRLILDEGFPRSDPYSFTAAGLDWVPQSWLASVTYAGLERAYGLELVRLTNGLLTGLLAVVGWVLSRPAGSPLRRLLVIAPYLAVGGFGWSHRPYLFALVCLGVVLMVVEDRLDPRWLLPVGWVWLNVHGSWPLGLVLVATTWLGRRLDGDDARAERRAGAFLIGGLVLGAVNPYGPRLLGFPLEAVRRAEAFAGIREWQAPSFRRPGEVAFLGAVALLLVALHRSSTWRTVVTAGVFLPAALYSARNIAVVSLVLVPLTAAGLASARPFAVGQRLLRAIAVIAGSLAALSTAAALGPDPFGDEPYPVAATEWLEENGLDPTQTRVIARDYVGNFFDARYGAAAQVFVDDRFELYPIAVLRDVRTLLGGDPGWDDVLRRYEADAVLWERDEPLAELLDASDCWDVTHTDDSFLVAVPTSASC